MKHKLRSAVCTEGRRMAGARALWVAAGMKHEPVWKAHHCHRQLILRSLSRDIHIYMKSARS